jgi:hypothetical protein
MAVIPLRFGGMNGETIKKRVASGSFIKIPIAI